nr:MAG TPA_asm: hypothetical protein [Caudoviricetes sp.]
MFSLNILYLFGTSILQVHYFHVVCTQEVHIP